MTHRITDLGVLLGVLLSGLHCSPARTIGLAGTSWQLVEFRGGDDTTLRPDDPSKYTVAFESDGRLSARIDCNRGRGSWQSAGPPQLEFGPLALTRAKCPRESLHDRIVKQWPYVRSYVMRDGHLFLSLIADGGIYEFEPMSSSSTVGAGSVISGTATYRERMALPPGAVLETTLEEVSRADAAAEVIGRTRVEKPGNPPIRFVIPYNPREIQPGRRYAVRARITVDGKPLFVTDRHYSVLTGGESNEVQLLLRRAPTSRAAVGSFEDTHWTLTHLGDQPVGATAREPHLIFERATRRVGGSGGCNHIGGSYELSGDSLTLSRMMGTMMACTEGMETERAFLAALERVRRWRQSDSQLELLDGGGTAVARFEARPR